MTIEAMTYVYNGEEVTLTGRVATNPTTTAVTYVEVAPVNRLSSETKWVKYLELHVVKNIEGVSDEVE